MRIRCIGGGPAGLYFSILVKRQHSGRDVIVFERNPAGVTHGWGIVFWDDLLELLRESDPCTAQQIADSVFRWKGSRVEINGDVITRSGGGYGIGRQRFLDILRARAAELGVRVEFDHEVDATVPPADADLIVACDGVNSHVRQRHAADFKTSEVGGRNKYIWLGTSRVFDAFTFAFVRTDAGYVWMHAYAFTDDCSTCIIECAPETWAKLNFEQRTCGDGLRLLERIFVEQLDGHPLVAHADERKPLPWLTFRTVTNRRWCLGNTVLLGDAAHTTHFAIGSGTKLALEDAMVLAASLRQYRDDVPAALQSYEYSRRTALLLRQRDAMNSARWFEHVDRFPTTDARLFAFLLHHRRSAILARLPFPAQRLAYAAHQVPMLRLLWGRVRSWLNWRYVRRSEDKVVRSEPRRRPD